jgi:predicted anti-sigma-YlaC factor YlaD
MALQPRPANCERARAWVSLRLDGELSELEEAFLVAHLRQCAVCSEYEETVRGLVVALRARPLEQLEHIVPVRGRRRLVIRPTTLARAAALVAAVVGVTTVLSTQSAQRPQQAPTVPGATVGNEDLEQLRMIRLINLGGQPPRGSGVGEFGAVLARRT